MPASVTLSILLPRLKGEMTCHDFTLLGAMSNFSCLYSQGGLYSLDCVVAKTAGYTKTTAHAKMHSDAAMHSQVQLFWMIMVFLLLSEVHTQHSMLYQCNVCLILAWLLNIPATCKGFLKNGSG